MNNLKGGLLAIAVGITAIIFRRHFRHEGPAGFRPIFDKEPTAPGEQWIVIGIGVLFIGVGLLAILAYSRE